MNPFNNPVIRFLKGPDGKINPFNDPYLDAWLVFYGTSFSFFGSIAATYEVTTRLFNAPKYNSWDHFTQPGGWASKWETRSLFDRVQGNKWMKRAGMVGWAYEAYKAGEAYHEGGKKGLFDYAVQSALESYEIVLGPAYSVMEYVMQQPEFWNES